MIGIGFPPEKLGYCQAFLPGKILAVDFYHTAPSRVLKMFLYYFNNFRKVHSQGLKLFYRRDAVH
jgi:hypothetical protein